MKLGVLCISVLKKKFRARNDIFFQHRGHKEHQDRVVEQEEREAAEVKDLDPPDRNRVGFFSAFSVSSCAKDLSS